MKSVLFSDTSVFFFCPSKVHFRVVVENPQFNINTFIELSTSINAKSPTTLPRAAPLPSSHAHFFNQSYHLVESEIISTTHKDVRQ